MGDVELSVRLPHVRYVSYWLAHLDNATPVIVSSVYLMWRTRLLYGVTAGAWTDGGAEVTSVARNSKETLMVTGEANGRLKLFRYPASQRKVPDLLLRVVAGCLRCDVGGCRDSPEVGCTLGIWWCHVTACFFLYAGRHRSS